MVPNDTERQQVFKDNALTSQPRYTNMSDSVTCSIWLRLSVDFGNF